MDFGGLFNPKNGKNPKKLTAENPGANPVLNQVMSATGGATHAFTGISRHVNASLKKIGTKNIEAGIGCGIGFGHGFGASFGLKPGVVHQFQLYIVQSMGKMMTKFGVSQSFGQPILPTSMLSKTSLTNQIPPLKPAVDLMQHVGADNPIQRLLGNKNLSTNFSNENNQSQDEVANSSYSNRTEKVISSFVQNPVMQEDCKLNEIDDDEQLQSENRMLHMVLKHEQVIEELKEENEKIRRILVEDLKISPHKFHSKYSNQSKPKKQRKR